MNLPKGTTLTDLLLDQNSDKTSNPACEAIGFALSMDCEEPMAFLRCWDEGDFDSIRNEWPEAPEGVFVGADPLHNRNIS